MFSFLFTWRQFNFAGKLTVTSTKPGIHQQLRKREKPLRTYGRRSQSTPELRGEPAAKKQRLSDDETQDENSISPSHGQRDATILKSSEETSCTNDLGAPTVPESSSSKKGSILNYFKPASTLNPPAPLQPDSGNENETIEETEPPALPVTVLHTKRKPRLLKIRASSYPLTDPAGERQHKETATEPEDGSDEDEDAHKGSKRQRRNKQRSAEPLARKGESIPPEGHTGTRTRSSGKSELANTRIVPTVQTTLNISAQAVITECTICDTVWNPLYPDDVKYHIKRHKAVLRAQKRKADEI